jgi:hypothetical protein
LRSAAFGIDDSLFKKENREMLQFASRTAVRDGIDCLNFGEPHNRGEIRPSSPMAGGVLNARETGANAQPHGELALLKHRRCIRGISCPFSSFDIFVLSLTADTAAFVFDRSCALSDFMAITNRQTDHAASTCLDKIPPFQSVESVQPTRVEM